MKIFFGTLYFLSLTLSTWASNTPPTRNEALDGTKSNLMKVVQLYVFQKAKYTPDHQKKELTLMMDSLYRGGYISLNQHKDFITGYLNISVSNQYQNDILKWNAEYNAYINSKFNTLKNNIPAKFNRGEISTAGSVCKSGLLNAPAPAYELITNPNCGTKTAQSCTAHEQCCSKYCEGLSENTIGSCIPTQLCFQEVSYGDECGPEDPYCDQSQAGSGELINCSSVNWNSSHVGECISNNSSKSCSSNDDCCSDKCESGKCIAKFICTVCMERGETPSGNRKCCEGLYEALNGTCQPDFPTFILPQASNQTNFFEKLFRFTLNLLVPSAVAQSTQCGPNGCVVEDGYNTLSAEDEAKIKEATQTCMTSYTDDEDGLKGCLDGVNAQRQSMIEAYGENGPTDGTKLTQSEYVGIYNIPAFTATEKSDLEKCEFNSWKDNWLDASRSEKNAEIILRAFETILSGEGTSDRIFFKGDKSDLNIYSRLKSIMEELRRNRVAMAKSLAETDKALSCECMNVFGVKTFSSEKQAAYVEECSGIVEQPESDSGKTVVEKKVAETDTGATGISHEEFLVKWLEKRNAAQMDRFQANEAVEEKFEELINDINSIDWDEHTRTKEHAYDFSERWVAGWFIILIVVVVAVAVVAFAPLAFGGAIAITGFATGGAIAGSIGIMVGVGAVAGGITAAIVSDPELGENSVDTVKSGGVYYSGIFKKQNYKRYLSWDKYRDEDYNSNKCDVRGRKKVCLKNLYVHEPDENLVNDQDYIDVYNEFAYSPLIDVWLPMFYPHTDSNKFIEDMDYVTRINTGYDTGFAAFKATKSDNVDKNWKSVDRLTPVLVAGAFNPDLSGMVGSDDNFLPQYTWNQDKIRAVKNAVIQYATCEKLTDCGATNIDDDQDLGLKYFFQNEEDAALFAEYVYQMHFFWPRLSSNEYYSYPLLGFSAYLDLVSYNVKLLGSFNLARSLGYSDAFDAYGEDMSKREGYYDNSGGDTKMGQISKNAKYSRSLFKALKLVNFSTGEGVEDFDKAIAAAKSSGELKAADLKAAGAAKKHAIRLQDDQKKRAHYDKYVEKSARGKRKLAAAEAFAKKFNDPLSVIKTMSPGTGVNPLTGKSEASSVPKKEVKTPVLSRYKIPDFKMPRSNYKAPSYGSSNNSTNNKMPAHGLGPEEVTNMLDRAKKDRSLRKVDPNDSIFSIVSKCYKRNLDRVLVSSRDIELAKKPKTPKIEIEPKSKISDEKKNKLKKLLGE